MQKCVNRTWPRSGSDSQDQEQLGQEPESVHMRAPKVLELKIPSRRQLNYIEVTVLTALITLCNDLDALPIPHADLRMNGADHGTDKPCFSCLLQRWSGR